MGFLMSIEDECLLKAAPELLECVKIALKLSEGYGVSFKQYGFERDQDIYDKYRRAIKLAEEGA